MYVAVLSILKCRVHQTFTGLVQRLNVIDIPFIFKDREHVYKVLDGEIGQGLLKELEQHD